MKRIVLVAIPLLAVLAAGCGEDSLSGVSTADPADPSDPPQGSALSYEQDVYPLFESRNCVQCHSGGGPGKDDGGLMLDTGPNPVYRELTEEISPNHGTVRVDLSNPSASLLLALPQGIGPHGVFFQDTSDPDYRTILAWIAAGAPR